MSLAVRRLEALVKRAPGSAEAWVTLASTYFHLDRFDRCRRALERALVLVPDFGPAWTLLGNCRVNQGDVVGAVEAFERALGTPGAGAASWSSYLFYLAFHPEITRRKLFDACRTWGERYAGAIERLASPARADARSPRRLRIGYVSYEFTAHVTSYFFEPILARHDKSRFELFLYTGNGESDAMTNALHARAEHWRTVSPTDPAAAAGQIREDGLDILVLVSSYRALHRRVMAFRPAPIQVAYHNLVSTTGLAAVDYMITETAADPVGSDAFYTERLVRLSERNCYAPPPDCPEVAPPPSAAAGRVSFGSFNNIAKLTPRVLALWARLLNALPEARLVLKNIVPMIDTDAWRLLRDGLVHAGAPLARVEFLDHVPDRAGHLAAYAGIDIALDPFPCNGGTTSCDALWMGVPVVTMAGETFMNRQGLIYLRKLGLDDLIADTEESYLAAAVALARAPDRRAGLRRTLRGLMRERLLCYDRHVRELESAYEEMWRRHCLGEPPDAFSPAGAAPL